MIGFNIFYSSDVHLTFSVISKLTEDDLLILISDSGETSEVVKAAELANENDILTVSITNFAKNKLNSISDFVLKSINFDLDMDVRIDSTASRISQLMILDTLFINILKEDFDKYKKMIQVNNKAVKRLR
jgi:DNA-binding MurR/RpiR family transcriptional regulator